MQSYTPEIKAQVIAAHQAGEANKAIARRLGLPLTTVRGWIGKVAPLAVPENKGWLDEQIWGLIADTIASIRAVARKAQDDEWLDKQTANDLAIYTGVQSDKLIRVLAALDYDRAGADAIRDHEGATLPG